MYRLFLLLTFCFSTLLFSQQISGIVTDEDGNAVPAVLVFNMNSYKESITNINGEFIIAATINDELRFVKNGFERSVKIVSKQDFSSPFNMIITRRIQEIEEVKITHEPTGNLEKDAKNYGDTKATTTLKRETAKYIRAESAPEVLAAKQGEFVQPVGLGFFVGKIDNQWDDIDFMEFLIKNIESDFFTDDLKLKKTEIQPFIYYIFRNFDRQEILFRGICSPFNLSSFMNECYQKIEPYRKNLPNNPPKIKKRK